MDKRAREAQIETYLVQLHTEGNAISDDELADIIRGESLASTLDSDSASLDRYLRLVPDLQNRLVALDAAIDVVLRRRSHGGVPDAQVVEELTGHYPHLAEQIREAAALSAGLLSSRSEESAVPARVLPSDFGPTTDAGVPRYRLLRLLGQGAHGQVYLAEDRQLADAAHRPLVALKLLAGGRRSERARLRLQDEAAKARRIDHPNVVRVFDRGVSAEGEDFIAYEYVPGGTLDAALPSIGSNGWARTTARLIAKVARGVQAAHHSGLVHCDLKPSNVLIADDGSPKVADFGIAARVVEPGDEVIRGTAGGPLGNLAFIAPEQYREEPGSVAIPADLYALGGLLYYALTRRLPNGSSAQEIAQTHARGCDDNAPPTVRAERHLKLDADIDSIVGKSLARQPKDRYASAGEFADDLERWADRFPVAARSSSPLRRVTLWTRRRPALASVLGVSACLTGGSLVALGMEYREQSAYVRSIVEAQQLNERAVFGANLLPTLWMMEQINGVSIMGRAKFDEFMFSNRFKLLSTEIERAHREGRGDAVMTLIWEVTLAHWVLQNPNADQSAEELLRESRKKWRRMLDPEDPMLRYVDMLCAVSSIREVWFRRGPESSHEPIDAGVLERVADAAEVIEDYLAHLEPVEEYSPGHLLAARALKHAYGGKLLGDRKEYIHWTNEVKRLEHGHLLPRDVPVVSDATRGVHPVATMKR